MLLNFLKQSKQEQAIIDKKDTVGRADNNPKLKQLLNSTIPDYKLVENMIDSSRSTSKTIYIYIIK